MATIEQMREQADEVAGKVGDTFIECWTMPPTEQWERIVVALAEHGYFIVKLTADF